MTESHLTVSAPGKLVLWGEYAVLAGANAGVMAVDRYAKVHLATAPQGQLDQWHVAAKGFAAPPADVSAHWFTGPEPAADHVGHLLWHAAQAAKLEPTTSATPAKPKLEIDTQDFYHGTTKLGLGSSAAVTVGLYALCSRLSAEPTALASALAAHHSAQAAGGSGIDVAASYYGGLLRFQLANDPNQAPLIAAAEWPEELHWQAWFSGRSASTPEHLGRFHDWRAQGSVKQLDDLVIASNACSSKLTIERLKAYIQALRAFDQASGVGVFAQGHENLHKLAGSAGLLYKPCGAGGGDLGIAISDDPEQLQAFATAAKAASFTAISLGMAEHGVRTSTKHNF